MHPLAQGRRAARLLLLHGWATFDTDAGHVVVFGLRFTAGIVTHTLGYTVIHHVEVPSQPAGFCPTEMPSPC